jgi:hypothetical protein
LFPIQTPKLPKETALISGQERTHDFPGIPFTNRDRCSAGIFCKAASIFVDVNVLLLTYYTRNRRIVAKFTVIWRRLLQGLKAEQSHRSDSRPTL